MFNLNVPFYSIMIFLALISNIILVSLISKKYKFTIQEIICLLLYENVGIIGGAKIFTFLQKYKEINGQFNFRTLGMTSYGAVIGILLFLVLFSLQFKKSFKELLYIFMPSIPLMYSIGKIGCFLTGCCFGIEYSGCGSVIYNYSKSAPKNINLFPVQILETLVFFCIFIYMLMKHRKNKFNIKTLAMSCILCGVGKFFLDFLRASHKGIIVSSNQIISIIFIVLGIIVYILSSKDYKKSNL